MKKSLFAGLVAFTLVAASAFAADEAKDVTLVGTGKCAKCSLGTAKECQTALVVTDGGKEETYLLANNSVSKKFHKNVCEEDKQIKVTGKVKEADGKKEIVASSIELVKS